MKSELKNVRSGDMVVLDVMLENFLAFKNFHMNLTYPKKIVDSCIPEEHLPNRTNFRYKKVNVIMGANASGKTSFGRMLMHIFNFLERKNYRLITKDISDHEKPASFSIDLASKDNMFYRVACVVAPRSGAEYDSGDIDLKISKINILTKDSYESCVRRLEKTKQSYEESYQDEAEKMGGLDWIFEHPEDTMRVLKFPKKDEKFLPVLRNILRALDPSIESVEASQDTEDAYVVRFKDRAVILQDGNSFSTDLLSSGTKAGVEVARIISSLMQHHYTFYYCDEKFPYVHTEIEKAVLSLMIDYVDPGEQLFFTTHNTDILDMNLPKHTFTFLVKDVKNDSCPIDCVSADSILKRNSDSLKNAVENDVFMSLPNVDFIYDIADL